ncbi:hypothetical protein ABZT02_03000 [Streptomyces sp. NPDC005402]|uniref:hypothetical protein n=1 Tax=Streptomyces sp. NPDC005402 TaxID=3155338 RepID=UPI0033AC92EE
MVNKLVGSRDQVAAAAQNAMADWQRLLQTGVERMIAAGLLGTRHRPSEARTLDSRHPAGRAGDHMTKSTCAEGPLLDALDTIFLTLREHAVDPPR